MKAKELIQLNNERRKQLTKENLKYYEDMLLYIRMAHDKSEQETEEVLSEMLDHLLEAQKEGKSAREVFGDDPKQYADEIIGELPKPLTKKKLYFSTMAILYFLAAVFASYGLFGIIINLFNMGDLAKEVYIWSKTAEILISIPIAFVLLNIALQYLRWACFKNINKVLEFFFFWVYGIFSIGLFMVVIYFMPDFGPVVHISIYAILFLGIILFIPAHMIKRSI